MRGRYALWLINMTVVSAFIAMWKAASTTASKIFAIWNPSRCLPSPDAARVSRMKACAPATEAAVSKDAYRGGCRLFSAPSTSLHDFPVYLPVRGKILSQQAYGREIVYGMYAPLSHLAQSSHCSFRKPPSPRFIRLWRRFGFGAPHARQNQPRRF